jgi:3-oxo-5-alpha-steroid 4-dehydrogenase 3
MRGYPGNDNDSTRICLMDLLAPFYVLLSLIAISSRSIPILATLASHGKTWKASSHWWWISKRYFVHFYVTGILSLLVATSYYWYPNPPSLAQILLFMHLLRRIYECCYVHRSRPSSQMHVAGYCLGVGHYLILPLVFFWRPTTVISSSLTLLIGIANLWMQYEQYQHHVLLAQLRTAKGPSYPLPPQRRWFRSILCPHYLAEILIYLSWALLLQLQDNTAIMVTTQTQHTLSWITLLKTGSIYRHWFLFLWVTTNLTISSRNSYDWYRSRSSNVSQAALIPQIF